MNKNIEAIGLHQTVLVIDDAPDSLNVISETFDPTNIKIIIALDGQQALSIVKNIKPDLILLDAVTPHLDSFRVYQNIVELPHLAAVPFIFLTDNEGSQNMLGDLNKVDSDRLAKPLNPADLMAGLTARLNKFN